MPILYALGIGMFLLSIKHKIREVWNTLVIVLIWLNISALLWRLFPQLHSIIFSGWDRIYSPFAPILQPFLIFLQDLVINLLKVFAGLGVS